MALFTEKEKTFLEIAYYILDFREFSPALFAGDDEYSWNDFLKANMLWINTIVFLDSIGVAIESEKTMYDNIINYLLSIPLKSEINHEFWYFVTKSIDYTSFNIYANTADDEYCLVRLYVAFRTGMALNKQAIEKITNRKITSNEMITLKKIIETKTFSFLEIRKDNTYVLRKEHK